MKKLKRTATIFVLILMNMAFTIAQVKTSASATTSRGWIKNDIFQDKVFIENKGQFDGKNNQPDTKIYFGINSMGEQIYFTSHGLTYRYDIVEPSKETTHERKFTSHEEEEKYEKKLMTNATNHSYTVSIQWLNANPKVQLIAKDIVPEYFTYGGGNNFHKAAAYKKIIYKELYPNVDVEYTFHEKEGIKYSLILYPGADASKIKMKYSGTDKLKTNSNGDLHISVPIGEIVDHAPVTFYDDNKSSTIPSSFNLNRNVISFHIENYNTSKTLIIDPWTVGVTLPLTNRAYEVEKDYNGNIFILGGGDNVSFNPGTAFSLKKYTAAGVLIWTYSFPNAAYAKGWYGDDLKIDKSGDAYVSTGLGSPVIYKVSSAGTLIWSGHNYGEPYRLLTDCNFSTLYVSDSWPPKIHTLNVNTGVETNLINGYYTLIGQTSEDLRDVVRSLNGNYYGVTAEQGNTARIRAFDSNWGNLWNTPAGFNITYWGGAYSTNNYPLSLHLVATTNQFLYITNGATLQKRNIANGALISTVIIPGGGTITNNASNSGIVIDTCGYIYVSSQAAVYKYDPNLTVVASAPTTAAVYDICLGNNGEVLTCGRGFLASLSLSACTVDPLQVTATATPTGNCSNGNIGTANATITGGLSSYSFYWIPGGQTTPTITGLGAGTYKVIVTDANCNKDSAIVTVTSTGALVTSVTQTNLKCYGGTTGAATVSASNGLSPYTYTWSTGNTAASVNGLGVGTYTVTVTDANGCKSILPINISQPPQIPISITTTGTSCNNTNGTAKANVSGSTGPYTYAWSSGSTYSNPNLLAAGTHTLTVTDSNGCTQTTTATVPSSTSTVDPSFTQSPNGTVCVGTNITFTHTGTPPGTGISYSWVISTITPANVSGTTTDFSYTFLTVGTYTVTHSVNDGTCNTSLKKTITVVNCSSPSVTAIGSSVCLGNCGTATSNPTGGTQPYTYSWSTGATTKDITPCPLSSTTYTVKVTDASGGTATSTAVVTVHPAIAATLAVGIISCSGGTGSVTATGNSGTSPYTFNWSTGATTTGASSTIPNLPANTYTVTVTDNKGCTTSTTATLTVPPPITGQFTKGTANCASCGCNEWILVNATGGTSPYTYLWPDSYDKRYKNKVCPGNYMINIKDKNGCSVDVSVSTP